MLIVYYRLYIGWYFTILYPMTKDLVFLEKYKDIIAQEVNVKEVSFISNNIHFKQTFSPIGRELSSDFGKDTWRIIWAAKSWNAVINPDGTLTVSQWNMQRILQPHQFENRIEGLDENHQTAESGVVVSLDFEMNDDLITEWIAREFSRFLNQMRKDADYQIDARVICTYSTQSEQHQHVLQSFNEFLKNEALLTSLEAWSTQKWDIQRTFESDEWSVVFSLQQ